MKILVIGSGGREHALVWKIAQSPKVSKIFCAPGNAGTGSDLKVTKGLTPFIENIPIATDNLQALLNFARKEKIDLTVVGPEAPLVDGIVDLFDQYNLPIIGPSKKAAQVEGSKVFAKRLMYKYRIPTAKFAVFDNYSRASVFLRTQKYPLVIKADGQCLGKGVAVCKTKKDASDFLKKLMVNRVFGEAGKRVIIEECLYGQEVSFTVATDGKNFVSLLPSQDHKPIFDEDKGPNTGGIGAYAPVPFVDNRLFKKIEKVIVAPTIAAMEKERCLYQGILYPGLILTQEGPKVLEFNCRLGDPETQPLMFLLKSDIVDLFQAIIDKNLKSIRLRWENGFAVCVILTSKGYPGDYKKGKTIYGFEKLEKEKEVMVFHAGTRKEARKIITSGGRVMGVTGRGKTLASAIKQVYRYIGKKGVYFSSMHYRKDIGQKGLDKKLWQ